MAHEPNSLLSGGNILRVHLRPRWIALWSELDEQVAVLLSDHVGSVGKSLIALPVLQSEYRNYGKRVKKVNLLRIT